MSMIQIDAKIREHLIRLSIKEFRRIMNDAGMTIEDLAIETGLDTTSIQDFFNGVKDAIPVVYNTLFEYFGVRDLSFDTEIQCDPYGGIIISEINSLELNTRNVTNMLVSS